MFIIFLIKNKGSFDMHSTNRTSVKVKYITSVCLSRRNINKFSSSVNQLRVFVWATRSKQW